MSSQSQVEGREQLQFLERLKREKASKPCSCSCPDTALQSALSFVLYTGAFLLMLLLLHWEKPLLRR